MFKVKAWVHGAPTEDTAETMRYNWNKRLTTIYCATGWAGRSNGYREYLLQAEIRKGGIPGHIAFAISRDYAARRSQ